MSAEILLDSILTQQKASYPPMKDDDFFEIYCADNILLNYDLSTDEISAGTVDGPRDAGIDSAYVLINRQLLTEDFQFDNIKQPVDIELVLIQSKNQDTFKEGPVDKLAGSLPLLLDANQSAQQLEALFKLKIVGICRSFIDAMKRLAGEFPRVSVRIYYCCKGSAPNDVTKAKAATLKTTLSSKYPHVEFTFLGAQELYDRSSKQKRLVKDLPVVGSPLSGPNSYVSLCTLGNYIKFISDDDGSVLTRIFEANVRAYQGEVEVNKEIAASLVTPTLGIDFWWLNNGVTIVADQAQFMNNQLTIENPLIVNGLQTSHELYNYGSQLPAGDGRKVLVRVIVEQDRVKRDEIIRATNRQTNIQHSSFRATEPIHREIEDFLKTSGFFYDRRKNQYKREGKPSNKIVSIDKLAQAMLSILKQQPHIARARPTTALKDAATYTSIFSSNRTTHPLEIYGTAIRLLTDVEEYFRSIQTPANQVYRNNLRFHVAMVLSWAIHGGSTLPALALRQLNMSKITGPQIKAVTDWVFSEFDKAGAEDRTAKDSEFTTMLKADWKPAKTVP
jgi:hypothetical protein